MNKRVIGALYKKEIMDILRDKKTILMMIVVPLVLYPLLFIGSMALTTSLMTQDVRNTYKIAVVTDGDRTSLIDAVTEAGKKHEYDFVFWGDKIIINNDGVEKTLSYEEAITEKYMDAYLVEVKTGDITSYEIVYDSSNSKSSTAMSMLDKVVDDFKENDRKVKITNLGQDPEKILNGVSYVNKDIATKEQSVGAIFGYIIPFLLVSSVLMGAMYPAIDTTAGEKERGTLETLLTLPVNNLEMIFSKFLATSTIASGAALLNVVSMGILGAYFYGSMLSSSSEFESFSLAAYIPAVIISLLLAFVFAMFSSAVCLLVCIFAKSFKEAQNYSTPVMLVFMISGMAGMIPSIELNSLTGAIPVVNVALLIGELFSFNYDVKMILYVFFANLAYSLVVVVLMARIFNSESILFGDGSDSIRLIEKRSNMKEKQIPGVGDIVLLLSLLIIVLFLAGSLLILKFGFIGVIGEQLMILGAALIYNWYIKTDFSRVFSLKAPKPVHVIAGFMTWAGYYVIALGLTGVLAKLFPKSMESTNDTYMSLFEGQPLWLMIIGIALMPAVCEELMFRGFLFGSLREKYKPWVSILVTGIVFGAYHMSIVKFFVVGLLGALFAYVVYKTKSIFVTMFMHFLNNATAVMLFFYEDELGEMFPTVFGKEMSANILPFIAAFIVSCILFAAGIIILVKTSDKMDNKGTEYTD